MRLTEALLIAATIAFNLLLGVHNYWNYQKYHSLIKDKYFSGKLTPFENTATARRCGALYQPKDFLWRAKREVIAEEKEYPWTVFITGPLRHCSGVLVSSRHVITAAYCVTRRLDNRPCDYRSPDDPSYLPVRVTETFVYPWRKNPLRVRSYSAPFRVVNITVHPDYNPCYVYCDLALLEISPNMFTEGLPICMPTEEEEVPKNLTTTRFYYSLQARPAYYLEAINFTLYRIDKTNGQLLAVSEKDMLCLIDIGGPLFKVNGSKHTLLGVTTANTNCRYSNGYLNLFEDVRNFTNWVCQISGVCPVKRSP